MPKALTRPIGASRAARPGRPRRGRRCLAPACWSSLAIVLAAWMALLVGEERWWPATLLLYAPRWPWVVPIAILAPISAAYRRVLLVPLACSSAIVLGPIWGFCCPWPPAGGGTAHGHRLRVLTLNTQGEHLDSEALRTLVAEVWPDVVLLQEWSGRDPSAVFPWKGWEVRESMGLCLASRLPILRAEELPPSTLEDRGRAARYEILADGRVIGLANIHLATPRAGFEAILDGRKGGVEILRQDTCLRRRVSDLASRWILEGSVVGVVAGDFNLTSDASIFRASWSSLGDAFEQAGLGYGLTKFTRWHGVRIDHILAATGWRAERCWVGPDVGSDHRPVVADLEIPPDRRPGPAGRSMVAPGVDDAGPSAKSRRTEPKPGGPGA
jgi:vancomycin resistance protein VanJ